MMTHDYKRDGTMKRLAKLNVLDGSVIGCNMQRHRQQELISLLDAVEVELPQDKAVHVILNNYATHQQTEVPVWLDSYPRWPPTSCRRHALGSTRWRVSSRSSPVNS